MSNRCSISFEKNGKILSIYCHNDGEPEESGVLLDDCYDTEASVLELMELGCLSELGEDLDDCEAYGRDCGEEDQEATEYHSREDLLQHGEQQFNYLFSDGEWYFYVEKSNKLKSKWVLLSKILEKLNY